MQGTLDVLREWKSAAEAEEHQSALKGEGELQSSKFGQGAARHQRKVVGIRLPPSEEDEEQVMSCRRENTSLGAYVSFRANYTKSDFKLTLPVSLCLTSLSDTSLLTDFGDA